MDGGTPGTSGPRQDGERGRGMCLTFIQDRKRCLLFTGFYSMVISLICLMFLLYRFNTLGEIYQYPGPDGFTQLAASFIWMANYGIIAVCAVLLIFGGMKDNRHCLYPWLLYSVPSVLVEFWALVRLFQIHTALSVELSGWEIFFVVLFAGRLLVHIVCFCLMVVHGRQMFKLEKKRTHLSGVINRLIPEMLRRPTPPSDQAVLQVTMASPTFFTVTPSYEAACDMSPPPPYSEGPPAYNDVIAMTPERPSVA